MEKSFNKTIKEVQKGIVQICNESGLSPIVLELILQNLLSEVRLMIEKQMFLYIYLQIVSIDALFCTIGENYGYFL